ncbi:MAG TPA: SprT family zinc-dependent metalloprotease [Candidatus Saccharimonadales bacterium]|nr:SprT family zinc-dependent metalloprotease [Candidatus Saccharimonadales bacterium]
MSQKRVEIPGIGEVVLSKRRGTTHLRLSVNAKGIVRVGMPYWTPYAAGIAFARERTDWINKHLSSHTKATFRSGDRIGKAHVLSINQDVALDRPKSRLTKTEVIISSPLPIDHKFTQEKIVEASIRALKQEAETLLPQRLQYLARQHGFNYKEVRIRSLTSRWGSCSTHKVITLSFYLMQLPWELIDYVLLHELVHTEQMNHGPDFWRRFESVLPGAKKLRKQVNAHKPRVIATNLGEMLA